jgi:hypothetical protein
MDLQDAEGSRLLEHPRPRGRIELVLAAIEREWIRAVGTAEWATVRQLGQ